MAVGNNISNIYKMSVGGKTFQVDPAAQGGYLKAYEQYAADRQNQLNATKAQLDKTLTQNNATTNANYDNNARQAYVDYMRKQRSLPSQLQALGVRGGATESGLLNLYNNYGVEHAANEQQRAAELGTNQNNRDDAYQSAYQQYLADLNEQKQQAISNQINEYNNEITRFSSSVAQYPTTQSGYESYQAWIKNMEASSDPLKDIKVALIRQQMATQFPNGAPESSGSGGSGGGGGGGYRRGGYSRGGSSSGSSDGGGSTSSSSSALPKYGTIANIGTGVETIARSAYKKAAAGKKATTTKKTTTKNRNATKQRRYSKFW